MTGLPRNKAWMPFAWRFVAAIVGLSLLSGLYGRQVVEHLLPLMQTELALLDDTYQYLSLKLDQVGAEQAIRLEVTQVRTITLGEQVFLPDARGRAHASTQWAHAILPAVLMAACALAWPLFSGVWPGAGRAACLVLARAVATTLAMAVMLAIDVPMVLWASIWSLHVEFAQPDRWSPLLIWRDFVEGGGRMALGLAMGCLCAWMSSDRPVKHRNALPDPHIHPGSLRG